MMSNPVRAFINLNKKCFPFIAKIFPNTKFSAYSYYSEQVRNNLAENQKILDVGGGKKCSFASYARKFDGIKLIGLDVSQEELDYNHDLDEKIVFDISSGERVPLGDSSIDMITSSSVLEHLQNLENAIKEIYRILKPGGKFISVIPCKFALFAIINQMLPNWLARKILFSIIPESKGFCGFKAYYDRCYYPALQKLLTKCGFTPEKFAFQYNQSSYFAFFLPFALISLVWDCLMYLFHVKPLAGYLCFVASK